MIPRTFEWMLATLIMILMWKWLVVFLLYIFAISLCWLMGGGCGVRFVEGQWETVMISQLSCELQAFWSDLFRTSTEILFMLRWYLIAVVGDVILTCHHQTWEVALPFSDHCILGNVTTLPQLNGCVSHCEPRWGKHRQYVMSKKAYHSLPPHRQRRLLWHIIMYWRKILVLL